MKRFSEQFKKKSDSIRLRATERADLRDRLVAYMEYHPLPQEMRTASAKQKAQKSAPVGIISEPFRVISMNMTYVRGFAGVFVLFLIVGVPFIAERAVPGDMLYPVKTQITEEVRASLTLSPYAKVQWETHRLERRVAEARLLASEGKLTPETEAQVAEAVKAHTDTAQQEIAMLRETDEDEADLAEITFASALEVQSEVLEGHIAKDPETETSAAEGKSVAALATVVHDAAAVAGVTQGNNTPSYTKLLGRVEGESTYAYELFESVKVSASEKEILNIERRLADIERKIEQAIALHITKTPVVQEESVVEESTATSSEDVVAEVIATTTQISEETVAPEVAIEPEEVPAVLPEETVSEEVSEVASQEDRDLAAVELLRAALTDVQKLIIFMTDIDVRQTVTIDTLVPVTLTDEERLATARMQYEEAKKLMNDVKNRVIDETYKEKVLVGSTTLVTLFATAQSSLDSGAVEEAESASADALALAQDIFILVKDMPVEDHIREEDVSPEEPNTEGTSTTTESLEIPDVEIEDTQETSSSTPEAQ